MNRGALKIGFIALILLLFLFCLVSPSTAQGEIGRNGGKIAIKTDIEMMSGVPVHGGGHVTWKVTGGAARELRAAILTHYDIPHGQTPPNGQLDIDEVDRYAKDVERYLENEGLRYHGANMRRFSLLNYDVEDDTKGLIRTSNASTENIELRYYFDAWMPSGNEEIPLADTQVSDAILAPLNETFVKDGEYEIEHTEYMVSVGDFSNVNIEEGTFYLIRTPFGDIYYYKVTFEAGEEPEDELLYEPFNWLESPLVLFIVVAILGYFTATMPGRFRRYDVTRIAKIHTLAKILVVILFLMYFFAGFGGIFIRGVYLWILSFVFLFVALVVSKTVYENAKRTPQKVKAEEPVAAAPIEEPEEPEPEEPKRRNVQCRTCGDIFHLEEWDTPASAVCPSCGGMGAMPIGDSGSGEEEEPAPRTSRQRPPPPPPPRTPTG
ncbi:MAG: hypothetical protein JSW28_08350 [Thermoplasmata archaeon]|nr:MAG: hypothetical protein JSW28_08350 [Thermoplasmata archaeon]